MRPIEAVANFLGRKTTIINPPAEKRWHLDVRVPVDDMSDLPVPEDASTIGEAIFDDALSDDDESSPPPPGATNSIWPHIEQAVYQQVMEHRSTIVFVNSRRTAERLTSQLNELWAKEHDPEALSPATRRPPAQLMKSVDTAGHAAPVIARAHHGSVSKDERAMTETLSLIHISEPTRPVCSSRMPSAA